MPTEPLYDYQRFNYDKPLYDINEIRKFNPQRHEMEQLTGVVHVDDVKKGIVGFKDVSDDEFWIKGHMPGFPLMPGVLLCEAAAQLAAFFARKFNLLQAGDFMGFGGMDEIRFRQPVYPSTRLIICAQATRIRPRVVAQFKFQIFNNDLLAMEGGILGVPISRKENL
ncbi:MAG: beta-hydroxyacyl-ACP dehydratase [Planctomyces sp.]|nr:beta-hydroxyacyl-ACP dehydratase [Planctomyces sp.]